MWCSRVACQHRHRNRNDCELNCPRYSGGSWVRHPCPSRYRAFFKHARCILQLHTEHVIDRCSSVVLLQCTQVGLTSLFGVVAFVDGVTGQGLAQSYPPTTTTPAVGRRGGTAQL